ncbi:hypothetical protein P2318_22880 [Myxococcaceae bacterium GXIMD 01537]
MALPPTDDPRALLDALMSGAALSDFPAEAVESARTLARDAAVANPAAVEALPEPLILAVLEGAVLAGSPVLPEALCTSRSKVVAKAARRAAYRLRSRGVAVKDAERPDTDVTPPTAPTPEALPALLSATTASGQFALVLARPLQGGGLELVQALISDDTGVLELSLSEVSRGGFRRLVRDARTQQHAVEVPREEAAALLAEGAGLNLRSHTPFPHGLELALRHHGVQPLPEGRTLPPPEPGDERLAVTEGAQLHEAPELRRWLPPEPELRRMLAKLDEVDVSPLALSPVQRQEQLLQAVRALAHAWFTPPVRQHYARRLWRTALYFERGGREHLAEVARAEARRLFHGPEEPPSRFAEALFEKALSLLLAEAPGSTEAAEGPTAPAEERRSPGGLIIP